MSIPKIIHYCWFGKNPLPDNVVKYINSWKEKCPDYEIIEWNENNFDVNSIPYVKQAYEVKKYAFVSDYVRLNALYNFGGFYLDTDVEVLKSFDSFLCYKAVFCIENNNYISTATMAFEKGHPLLKEFINYYENKNFVENGRYDYTTNVVILSKLLVAKGLELNNEFQEYSDFVIYPNEFFSPKDYIDGKIYKTENTVAIHHFSGTWQTKEQLKYTEIKKNYGKYTSKIVFFFWLLIHSPKELVYLIKRKFR